MKNNQNKLQANCPSRVLKRKNFGLGDNVFTSEEYHALYSYMVITGGSGKTA